MFNITENTTKKQLTKGLKKIGKGAFTECYLLSEDQVMLVTVDPLKDIYSMGWINNELFPVTHRVNCLSSGETVFTMERYNKVSSLKNSLDVDQYEIYKTFRKIFNEGDIWPKNLYDGYQRLYAEFSKIEDQALRDTMIETLDGISNYGSDIGFEISPRNVAVKNGKLILLDCFYMRSTLIEVRKGK